MELLNTGVKNVKNVSRFTVGPDSTSTLAVRISEIKDVDGGPAIVCLDQFLYDNKILIDQLELDKSDVIFRIDTAHEPKTHVIDELMARARSFLRSNPSVVVGIGGGIAMDTAKAISNLYTNKGSAADYQGWDLLKEPAVYKIGVPTISGTGAEATRTCVMTNESTGLKLGMNSDYTVFDELFLDPNLTKTVPRSQYFYSGMDAYIHCVESLAGSYRNAVGDAYSQQTLSLCREVFLGEEDMMSDDNRERLMVASYLGGCAVATSYVGLIHPFSAGLSVVLGLHHCVANCIVMNVMEGFYQDAVSEFQEMLIRQKIHLPRDVCKGLSDEDHEALFDATLVHARPLVNALGATYEEVLTREKVREIFSRM